VYNLYRMKLANEKRENTGLRRVSVFLMDLTQSETINRRVRLPLSLGFEGGQGKREPKESKSKLQDQAVQRKAWA